MIALAALIGLTALTELYLVRHPSRRSAPPWWLQGMWALVLAEVGLTIWFLTRPLPPDPPALDVVSPVPDVFLARGLFEPPAPGPTVLVVGDSFVQGLGVAPEHSLPRQLDGLLAGPRVLNHGSAGDGFADEVARYIALGARHDPDVVLWVFLLNDIPPDQAVERFDLIDDPTEPRTGIHLLDVPWRAFDRRALGQATIAAHHQALAPDRPAITQLRSTLSALAAESTARGARFVFVLYPLLYQLDASPFAQIHADLADLAADAGAEVVDLLPAFAGRDARTLWASPSDHHPNALAHGIAAAALAEHLEEIPASQPRDCAALPAEPPWEGPLRAACHDPGAATWLRLADALLDTLQDPARLPVDRRLLAIEVATAALEDDPTAADGVRARIEIARRGGP